MVCPPTLIGSARGPSSSAFSTGLKLARKSATKASISASETSPSAATPRSAPTGTVSPSATTLRRSVPATGLSKALAILDVSMSMISSPTPMAAPSSTAQRASMPSSMASPHLGMVIAWIAGMVRCPSVSLSLSSPSAQNGAIRLGAVTQRPPAGRGP